MMQKTVIEINDLVKKYGEVVAVDGVSFKVKSGELFDRDKPFDSKFGADYC